jgi:hypothetical protein
MGGDTFLRYMMYVCMGIYLSMDGCMGGGRDGRRGVYGCMGVYGWRAGWVEGWVCMYSVWVYSV